MATSTAWKKDTKGRLLCRGCDGEKRVEVQLPARSRAQEEPEYRPEDCEECDGSGLESCSICGDDATVAGADGKRGYCGAECAETDDNAPPARITIPARELRVGDVILSLAGLSSEVTSITDMGARVRIDTRFAGGAAGLRSVPATERLYVERRA